MTTTTLDSALPLAAHESRVGASSAALRPWRALLPSTGQVMGTETWQGLRARFLAARVERTAEAGRPIVLGDASHPYEVLPGRRDLLERLGAFRGLTVRIVSRGGAAALDDLDRLAHLDREHVVAVDLHLPAAATLPTPSHLEVARQLSARGLTVHLVLPVAAAACRLAPILREAHAAGIHDVALAPSAPSAAHQRLDRLRFEAGFPHPLPTRG
ncbi:MAG: hypothetical protein AAGC60_15430 [Acidobacteriota bacterium]